MERKEYLKQWREQNKEKLKEYQSTYFQDNKKSIYEKRNQHYEDNREEILKKRNEKEKETGFHHFYINGYKDCVCGKELKISSIYQHRKICNSYKQSLLGRDTLPDPNKTGVGLLLDKPLEKLILEEP